jgi:hypothetical protein
MKIDKKIIKVFAKFDLVFLFLTKTLEFFLSNLRFLGCLIFFLAVVDELIRVIKGGKPRYQQMAEQRLSAGDFGETL